MNFNITEQPEYDLNTSMVDELIQLYGVLTKFVVAEKINVDDVVFGDYSHLKTDGSQTFEIYMLPETSETFENTGYNFNMFGLTNLDNISLFVSKTSFDDIEFNDATKITSNLIVLPNNKIMEITDVEPMVPGINNLFTYNDAKSVYKLSCKPYDKKIIDEISNNDISYDQDVDYDTLDNYFNELTSIENSQNDEANVNEIVPTVVKQPLNDSDDVVQKSIVDKSEDSVFGDF